MRECVLIDMHFSVLGTTDKIQKSGQKSKFSEKRFIFQRLAGIEAAAKILGHWDFL